MTGVPDKADWLRKALDRVGVSYFWLRVATKRKSWPFSWPATFRKKWAVGARRCPMSAKAEANAAAALRELGATG